VLGPLIAANHPARKIPTRRDDRGEDQSSAQVRDGGIACLFGARAVPKTPADLSDHFCIRNMYPNGVGYPWSFGRSGEEIDVEVKGSLALHDHELMI